MAAGAAPEGQDDVAADVKAAETGSDTRRIHNCDQRSPVIAFAHNALERPLRLEQRGANSEGFVTGTSSVAWPVAEHMARRLCEEPGLVRGRSVVELGAGIGLVGAVAAALGAGRAVLTDCERAVPLLERNREVLAQDGVEVEVATLSWGEAEDHAAVLADGPGFDTVVASDVLVAGFDTDKLLASIVALLRRTADARVHIAYEFREEWETIGNFLHWAEQTGLECSHQPLFEEDDGDMFLYTLRWKVGQEAKEAT